MKKIIYIILFILSIIVISCFPDQRIGFYVKNNSSNDIVVCASYIFPDTLLPVKPLEISSIESEQSGLIHGWMTGDPKLERLKTEYLTVFIIDKQVYSSNSWDSLRIKNLILQKYHFNEAKLQSAGWKINYP
jgi:hypothetical protein